MKPIQVYDLKTEYRTEPYGIDSVRPRFSWKIASPLYGIMQVSYHILAKCGEDILWDSGVIESEESQRICYAGTQLKSGQTVVWRVEICCKEENGQLYSATSEWTSFTMGLLKSSDWKCKWISPKEGEQLYKPAAYLRKKFFIKPGLDKAVISQTAHGLYESWINGSLTTEDKFKPGLTSYYHRLQYQMYDITKLLTEGENVWAASLGDGWWRGYSGGNMRENFGTSLAYYGQIHLWYQDGSEEWILTDKSFHSSTGQLLVSDMFMGDEVDACLEPVGWKNTGFNDENWTSVELTEDWHHASLIASNSVPVREMEEFLPVVFMDKAGNTVFDFGQNIAGYVRMCLRNTKTGQKIHLTHGEDIDADGVFSMENIRQLGTKEMPHFQEVIYTCSGAEKEEYCPMFSIFGFRYVKLEGYEAEKIQEGDFTAVAVYSQMEEAGDFTCSNPYIDQFVKNSRWSQKGNYMDVAIDCPTRERNAWTGDNQIYVKTAADFMNVYPFYEKWLQDMALEQYESGKIGITFPSTSSPHCEETYKKMKDQNPLVAQAGPNGNGSIGEDCAGWGDAAAYLPYNIYLCYGDKQILRNQYQTAKKWVDYMLQCAKEHNPYYAEEPQYHQVGCDGMLDGEYIYDTRMHYGEWQEPIQADKEIKLTPEVLQRLLAMGKPLVATAYMCRSAENVAQMAGVLGLLEDQKFYEEKARRIREVYDTYFIKEDGKIEPGHQAAYVRVLQMNLCSIKNRSLVQQQLLQEIQENGGLLNTGFLSTPFLLPVLVEMGESELAFQLLEETKAPSWLHPVLLGATTIPESWYALDKHESSYNHYAFGAVCDFLFSYVAGIRPTWEAPGYKVFELHPIAGGSLTYAKGSYESLYGTIVSEWTKREDGYEYHCVIPANTRAKLSLQDGSHRWLSGGSYVLQLKTEQLVPRHNRKRREQSL